VLQAERGAGGGDRINGRTGDDVRLRRDLGASVVWRLRGTANLPPLGQVAGKAERDFNFREGGGRDDPVGADARRLVQQSALE
jgi:hypothetical protein